MLKKCCSFVIILIVTLIRKGPLLPQNESLVFFARKRIRHSSERNQEALGRTTTPLLNLIMTLITMVTNSSLSDRL
jgi:hypothetical protein